MVLLGALFAGSGILFGMSYGTAAAAADGFAEHVGRKHKEWYVGLSEAQKGTYPQWVRQQLESEVYGNMVMIVPEWWDGLDRRALFHEAGGWRGAVRWSALWMWVPVFLAAAAMGAFYSIALLGVRRRRLLFLALAPIGLAALFALLSFIGAPSRAWGGMYMSSDLAQRLIGPGLIAMTLAFALPCLWLGVWSGRPLARTAARLLLPARLRTGLSVLWVADGLDPPGASHTSTAPTPHAPVPQPAPPQGTRIAQASCTTGH